MEERGKEREREREGGREGEREREREMVVHFTCILSSQLNKLQYLQLKGGLEGREEEREREREREREGGRGREGGREGRGREGERDALTSVSSIRVSRVVISTSVNIWSSVDKFFILLRKSRDTFSEVLRLLRSFGRSCVSVTRLKTAREALFSSRSLLLYSYESKTKYSSEHIPGPVHLYYTLDTLGHTSSSNIGFCIRYTINYSTACYL